MDIVWIVLGILFLMAGLVGCLLPLLPGPPLCYIGLLLQQLRHEPPYTTNFLLVWAGVTVIVTVLDYVVPVYGAKRYGGSRQGVWGSTLGLLAGLFFPPWGLIIGPFLGAFVGEMIATNNSHQALRAAFGSFVGFLFGTLLKLVVCVVMIYYFFANL